MKQQRDNWLVWTLIGCLSLAAIAILSPVVPPEPERAQGARRFENIAMEAQRIEASVKVQIGDREILVYANVNDRGLGTDIFIREALNSVGWHFSILDWPGDWPVEMEETDHEIVITWPLSPALKAMHAYKPDYTARAILDKETKKVLLFAGG